MPASNADAIDEQAIKLAKRVLRRAVGLRRDVRPESERHRNDVARLALVRDRLLVVHPETVACYLSVGSEPGTLSLVGWLAALECRILLPVLTDDGGRWLREPAWGRYAGPDRLRTSRAGLVEPDGPALSAGALGDAEVVICPGVAGTETGDRLGRGGGWYDRVLPHASGPIWLLLNDDEILPELPTAPWDRRVDGVVTPTRFIAVQPPHTA